MAHTYVTQNGKVMRETIGTGATAKVLDFIYDNNGKPFALIYTNGTAEPDTYYYVLNRQGDVVALMTAHRTIVAQYTYNAWGKILQASGTMASTNPLRYRGYYYDTETGFYYLQSRYYDPANHSFLTADVLFDRGVGFVGFNLYLYCGNNPVNRKDASGFDSIKVDDGDGDILELETYGGGSGGGSGRDVGGGNNSGGTSQGNSGSSVTPSVSAAGKSPGHKEQRNQFEPPTLNQINQYDGNGGHKTHVHHIVERCQESKSGFSHAQIENPNNKIRIPASIHGKISGYYSSKPGGSGTLRVRDSLAGMSFEEQWEFGLDALLRYLLGG